MKIINQSHKILSLPDQGIALLELAGRTCYKSEDKITKDSSKKFVKMLVNNGHHAMIEFGDIMVKFVTNRGVTHELVRHRMCSFAQESTRYVKYDGIMEFIKPVWVSDDLIEQTTNIINVPFLSDDCHLIPFEIWANACLRDEQDYKSLLKAGWKAQQAREILPNSLKTEIVMKANIREWRHIFSLRCGPAAHPQMSSLMIPLRDELKTLLPVVFNGV